MNDRPAVLITGASRGIGLALTEAYASRGAHVHATCRSPDTARELHALAGSYDRIDIRPLDVASRVSIDTLATALDDVAIDLLINNAAILGRPDRQSAVTVDYDEFHAVMSVNTFGPLAVALAFMEHVARSRQKKIVTLTSGLSSVAGTRQFGGLYFYRASKAGINVAMRALQADIRERGVTCAVVAPGIVDTGLLAESGYRGESLDTQSSADGLVRLIAGLGENSEDGFPLYDGTIVPW